MVPGTPPAHLDDENPQVGAPLRQPVQLSPCPGSAARRAELVAVDVGHLDQRPVAAAQGAAPRRRLTVVPGGANQVRVGVARLAAGQDAALQVGQARPAGEGVGDDCAALQHDAQRTPASVRARTERGPRRGARRQPYGSRTGNSAVVLVASCVYLCVSLAMYRTDT